jgi:hypothetical protein
MALWTLAALASGGKMVMVVFTFLEGRQTPS